MAIHQDIYIIGIGGTGTGALAGLLKEAGHHVWGSDTVLYPPMSDRLASFGIEVFEGYDARHLQPHPDKVVIGNVIRKDNPEAAYARAQGIVPMSMPEAVAQYGIGDRHSIVMAGTHGKTTTTALVAHLLTVAKLSPGFLIGGAPVGGGPQACLGQGRYFVVEGDEYDTAYFDKRPKFLHYRAKTAVITSLEFDHADIFEDVPAIQKAFAGLMAQVPTDGTLVVWRGATLATALLPEHRPQGEILLYDVNRAEDNSCALYMAHHHTDATGLHFEAILHGTSLGPMQVPLWGAHSALNVLAALGAVAGIGIDSAVLRDGFASFKGVRRRMEVVLEHNGITVVDDFGHHPTAVSVTLAAAKERFVGRRLWAVFEPRSATSRRRMMEADYITALAGAGAVIISHHTRLAEIPEAQRFNPERVAAGIKALGVAAWPCVDADAIVTKLMQDVRPGDVVMVLSNGDFDGLIGKLKQALLAAGGAS